jgi:acyl-CoA dehydrogenase
MAQAHRRRQSALGFHYDRARAGLAAPIRAMMRTRAEKKGDKYVITGRKWFITGADGAAHFILMARTSDDKRRGLTAFLYHKDQPGWRIVRRIPIMGPEEHGGHCELEFDGLEVPTRTSCWATAMVSKVTQIRLGPARLTHCMRWLGWSKRCMEIAQAYVKEPRGFRRQTGRPRKRADQARRGRAADPDRPACSPCMRPGSSIRATARARKFPWPKCMSPIRCTWPADVAIQLQGRARLLERHGGGMDLPRCPRRAARRRRVRSAQ